MKSRNFKYFLSVALMAGLFSSCINDDNYDNVTAECVTLTPTKTVQDIYALAPAASISEGTPILYTGNDIIEAYVTSSDAGSTFYKSISFQTLDGSLAFSIPVDMYNIYNEFIPGRKVYINLQNRYFAQVYGSLIIGDLYEGTKIGRLVPEEFRRTVKASCEIVDEEVLVQHLTIDQVKNDNNINKLIQIDNVQFEDDALTNETYYNPLNEIGGASNLNLVDEGGNSIIFRTSSFAKFAGHLLPNGRGSVRGVLTKYQDDYQFLARTEADINLTGPRLVPLFEETFTNNFPNWTKVSVLGTQVWTLDTQFGNPGNCAKMSGFASGNNLNEDWLISPSIDMSTASGATLTFDTATKFAGNPLQILISGDYSSGSPTTATWTTLTATLSPSTGNYVWTASGPVDVSAFAGNANVHVAFKYTSTTTAAATWEVDNVKVTAN